MSRVQVTPFLASDYVALADALRVERGLVITDPAQTGHACATGRAFTMREGERVLGCAGIVQQWAGLGYAWAVVTVYARASYPMAFHYAVRRGLGQLAVEMQLRRVEATVLLDFEVGRRWARLLGFLEESVMPHYDAQGRTHVRMVFFPKEAA